MAEDEGGKQKPEGGKQKPEGGKKKLVSSISNEELQRWQTYILALIIIVAYIVFFGYIIITAQDMPDQKGKNWSGMTTLTGTFGIIAAAVVGYYFGQRNLKQAGDIAQHAIEISKVAKDDAEGKKTQLKEEKKDSVSSLKTAVPIYNDAKKFVNLAKEKLSPDDLKSISKVINIDSLENRLEGRIGEVHSRLKSKEKEIEET